jgi:hypothetical protein
MEQKNDGGSFHLGHTNLWNRGPNAPVRFW